MITGRLGYNSANDRYGLLVSDLWEHDGFHCGEVLEVMVDDKWQKTRMEMGIDRQWYLVGTPFCEMSNTSGQGYRRRILWRRYTDGITLYRVLYLRKRMRRTGRGV